VIFRFLLDAKEQLRRPCRLIRRKSGRRCPKGKGIARPLPAAGFQGTLTNRFESSKNGKTPPAGGVFPKFVDCRRCGIAASQGLLPPARAGAPSPDAGKDMFGCPFADSAREPEKAEGWRKAAG